MRFLQSILISNFRRLSFPFKLSYAVTYRCNLKCKMCNIWRKDPSNEELNVEDVDNFFKHANKFFWIGITGGEAFLRQDLPELIDRMLFYCKDLSALHFATNGQLNDKIEYFMNHVRKKHPKIKIVYTISIDGPSSLHDEIRGGHGVWKRAVDTFKYLKSLERVKVQIGFTLSPHNMNKFQDTFLSIKEIYPDFKFDDMTVNIFQKSSFYYDNENMEELDNNKLQKEIGKILEIDKEALSVNNFLRRRYLNFYLKYIKTNKCPLKCRALSSTCFLDPYGDLFPCTIYNKKLLNIKDMRKDFEVMWNSDSAKALSCECSNHICPSCWSPCDAYSAIAGSLLQATLSKG